MGGEEWWEGEGQGGGRRLTDVVEDLRVRLLGEAACAALVATRRLRADEQVECEEEDEEEIADQLEERGDDAQYELRHWHPLRERLEPRHPARRRVGSMRRWSGAVGRIEAGRELLAQRVLHRVHPDEKGVGQLLDAA